MDGFERVYVRVYEYIRDAIVGAQANADVTQRTKWHYLLVFVVCVLAPSLLRIT